MSGNDDGLSLHGGDSIYSHIVFRLKRSFWSNSMICSDGKRKDLRYVAAAAAAKSLQSCPTLCNPIDGSPPGCPVPGILQARTLEWVAISFSNAGK